MTQNSGRDQSKYLIKMRVATANFIVLLHNSLKISTGQLERVPIRSEIQNIPIITHLTSPLTYLSLCFQNIQSLLGLSFAHERV